MHGGGTAIVREFLERGRVVGDHIWNVYLWDGEKRQVEAVNVRLDEDKLIVEIPTSEHAEFLRNFLKSKNEPSFKAFGRIGRPSVDERWNADQLSVVADLLPADVSNNAQRTGGIPAAYTYFGQFIAHDLSNLSGADLTADRIYIPTACLDLDTLFTQKPTVPADDQIWAGEVGVGRTSQLSTLRSFDDLPRDDHGVPVIKDKRNDQNLSIAQTQVALSKFHQFVFHQHARGKLDLAKKTTIRHVQSVVLHDFLSRLIDPDVYYDVVRNGRQVVHPGVLTNPNDFVIPLEFSAACFRVAHSMVKGLYEDWHLGTNEAHLRGHLLAFTHLNNLSESQKAIEASWKINWRSMLDGIGFAAEMTNHANSPDPSIAEALKSLDRKFFSQSALQGNKGQSVNLAKVTLARTMFYDLPSAQELIADINVISGQVSIQALSSAELFGNSIFDRGQNILLRAKMAEFGFDIHTPLWLYCLLETDTNRSHVGLGPLASRIVMETIHASIEACPNGIISRGNQCNFTADECISNNDTFRLEDIILISEKWTPP